MLSFRTYYKAFFLLFSLFISGCCSEKDLKVNPAVAAAWLPNPGPSRIQFRNETGDTLTFTSTRRSYNQQATDKACGTYHIQTEEITLFTPADPDLRLIFSLSHEMVLNLQAINNKTRETGLEAKFNTVSEIYITHAWRDTYAKEQVVAGQSYGHILRVYGNNITGNLALAEILYAKEKGLVGLRTFTGGWYYKI